MKPKNVLLSIGPPPLPLLKCWMKAFLCPKNISTGIQTQATSKQTVTSGFHHLLITHNANCTSNMKSQKMPFSIAWFFSARNPRPEFFTLVDKPIKYPFLIKYPPLRFLIQKKRAEGPPYRLQGEGPQAFGEPPQQPRFMLKQNHML